MTITNQYVEPVQAGAMPGGLLDTARPIVGDWTGGVTFRPVNGQAGVWSCINDGSEKDINGTSDPFRVDPFMLYAGFECDGPIEDQLEQDARTVLERSRSQMLAQQLVVSDPLVGNSDLSTDGTDITPGGGPVGFRDSVAGLLSAISDCGGGEVMLHVPLIALPYLDAVGVKWNGTGWFLGPIPVSVDAYPNPDGDPPTDPDNAYVYLTRPVEYGVGEVQVLGGYKGRLNNAVVVVEQLAIVRYDPACVYSINVDFGAN